MSKLREMAEEAAMECDFQTDKSHHLVIADAIERVAKQFAMQAIRVAIPYDSDHPNYSSEEYEDEIHSAIAAAERGE